MSFAVEYANFIERHTRARRGERLRRLREGHAEAERMFLERGWWPVFGHFDYLHPEYEVIDFKDGTRYLDYAYIRPPLRACFEIDGFGPHWRDISRTQFADQCIRQNHLVLDGWTVIRFAYDDIAERPRRCQQMIQQWFGRALGELDGAAIPLPLYEMEVVRIAFRLDRPLTCGDLCAQLGIGRNYALKLLGSLAAKQLLIPASGTRRIRSYRLYADKAKLYIK